MLKGYDTSLRSYAHSVGEVATTEPCPQTTLPALGEGVECAIALACSTHDVLLSVMEKLFGPAPELNSKEPDVISPPGFVFVTEHRIRVLRDMLSKNLELAADLRTRAFGE